MRTDRNHNRTRGIRTIHREGAGAYSGGGPSGRGMRTAIRVPGAHAVMQRDPEPVPIWLAALVASRCHADVDGENHAVAWNCIAGRALYTNTGTAAERIEPLGVQLQGGHTLAVYWRPGESNYTVEVYSQSNHFHA